MIFLPAIVLGFVGDAISMRYGRRVLIWGGSVIILAGAIFQALSRNRGQFMGCKWTNLDLWEADMLEPER